MWSVDTTAFVGEQGRVQQVQCRRVEWVADEEGGPARPRPAAEPGFALKADLVLLAMGFVGPGRTALCEELALARDARGFLARDGRHMTGTTGLFVTGDMHRGPSLVVHAIADGTRTARQVMSYLKGSV